MSTKLINYKNKNCNEICYNRIRNRKKCIWSGKCQSSMCLVREISIGDVSGLGNVSLENVSRGNIRRRCVRRGNAHRGSAQTPSMICSFLTLALQNKWLGKYHSGKYPSGMHLLGKCPSGCCPSAMFLIGEVSVRDVSCLGIVRWGSVRTPCLLPHDFWAAFYSSRISFVSCSKNYQK